VTVLLGCVPHATVQAAEAGRLRRTRGHALAWTAKMYEVVYDASGMSGRRGAAIT
jgi:hypothetical protein